MAGIAETLFGDTEKVRGASASDIEAIKLFEEATELYNEYLRLAQVGTSFPSEPSEPKRNWDHPMWLVLQSRR